MFNWMNESKAYATELSASLRQWEKHIKMERKKKLKLHPVGFNLITLKHISINCITAAANQTSSQSRGEKKAPEEFKHNRFKQVNQTQLVSWNVYSLSAKSRWEFGKQQLSTHTQKKTRKYQSKTDASFMFTTRYGLLSAAVRFYSHN